MCGLISGARVSGAATAVCSSHVQWYTCVGHVTGDTNQYMQQSQSYSVGSVESTNTRHHA